MRLKTLGPVSLENTDFRRSKSLLLLAYLAVEGPRERQHLRELFWPDATDAALSLRVVVAQIRALSHEALSDDGSRLSLGLSSDIDDLQLAFREAPERVAAIYTGAFLEDIALTDWGAELENWVLDTRELVAAQVRTNLIHVAEMLCEQGEMQQSIKLTRRAWRLPGARPLDTDELQRLYALSLSAGSELSGVLRQEAQEHGLELHSALSLKPVQASPEADLPSRPAALPSVHTAFIGRQQELGELRTLLCDPEIRLLTLLGPGGIGKTRLALELASTHAASRVFYVPLEAISLAQHVAGVIAGALGLSLAGGVDHLELLKRSIGNQNLLLVLDNFEQFLSADAGLAGLLEACSGLTLLVTSRERLDLPHETLYPLTGLDLAGNEHADAVRLFVSRARKANARFRLTPESWPHALEICRRVDGSPLGIELAAAWIRTLPVSQIAAELTQGSELLDAQENGSSGGRRNLRVIFEQTWSRLSIEQREVLSGLAIFRGGFTREAAAAVLDATLRPILALLDASLVKVSGAGRYTQHPLLQSYVREKLAEHPARQTELEGKFARYFLNRSDEAFDAYYAGQGQLRQSTWWATESGNIEAALEYAEQAGEIETALGLCRNQSNTWIDKGQIGEGIERIRKLLSRAGELTGASSSHWALLTLCQLKSYLGRWDEEMPRLLVETIALAEAAGDGLCLSQAMNCHGLGFAMGGDLNRCSEYLQEALLVARQFGSAYGQVMTLGNLAMIRNEFLDLSAAKRYLSEGIELAGRSGLESGQAALCIFYVQMLLTLGDYVEAEAYITRAEKTFTDFGRFYDLGYVYKCRALTALWRNTPAEGRRNGDLEAARSWFIRSKKQLELGFMGQQMDLFGPGVGDVLLALGDVAVAADHFEQELAAAEQEGNVAGAMNAHFGLARVAQTRDQEQQALEHFRQMLARTSNPYTLVFGLSALAATLSRLGQHRLSVSVWGAVVHFQQEKEIAFHPVYREEGGDEIDNARVLLGETEFERAWSEGARLNLTEATQLGLA